MASAGVAVMAGIAASAIVCRISGWGIVAGAGFVHPAAIMRAMRRIRIRLPYRFIPGIIRGKLVMGFGFCSSCRCGDPTLEKTVSLYLMITRVLSQKKDQVLTVGR
jgi:hypothetical protein